MTSTLIILAAGASSRMKQASRGLLSEAELKDANSGSKSLIRLNNRPMLDYILYNAKKTGFKTIVIVTGNENSKFRSYYGENDLNNDFHGLKISFAIQHIPSDRVKPFGTADALQQAIDQFPALLQESFVVCNGDNLYSEKAFRLLSEINSENAFINYDRDALQFPVERIAQFAITNTDSEGFLKEIIEKPKKLELKSEKSPQTAYRVSMNLWKLNGSMIYSYLKNCKVSPERDEKELPVAILSMIQDHPHSMKAIPLAEHVPDLTGKDDIAVLNDYLSTHYSKLNWTT
ncbi:MAG: nucleotidyltransferase [Flavobacterium sp.]|nr:MAG: nucleotidyltransferase [Flavobacterium sp.]